MKRKSTLNCTVIAFFMAILTLGASPGRAQTQAMARDSLTAETDRTDRMSGTLGDTKVTNKMSAAFSAFLGADTNAVVSGLRNGTPITLTSTVPGSTAGSAPVTTTTTIIPPTGKMGFGNVFITLALAKQELGRLGITQPTPQQLQAALLGGTVTTGSGSSTTTTNLQGILALRSQHMGWGQIAQRMGFRLGTVVSALRTTNHGLVTGVVSREGRGIVNGANHPMGVSESESASEKGLEERSEGRERGKIEAGARGKIDSDGRISSGFGHSEASEGAITTSSGRALGVSGSGSLNFGAGRSRGR